MKGTDTMIILKLKPTDVVTKIVPVSRTNGCTVDLVTIRHGAPSFFRDQYGKRISLRQEENRGDGELSP